MVSTLVNNLIAFAISMPTNMVILIIICLIMKCLMGYTTKDCIKIVFGYLLIGLLLGIFGITMPSFLAIGRWVINMIRSAW